MRILGIDFTSAPARVKPITAARCVLDGTVLRLERIDHLHGFRSFEAMLNAPGPWVGGFDFPFGQARRFVETVDWPLKRPLSWQAYVAYAHWLGRARFVTALEDYKADRATGDKQHRRVTDRLARSQSPQTLYGTPVAKMWFEGAVRLADSGLYIPLLQEDGDTSRVAVEAYPGVMVRALLGSLKYKGLDEPERRNARIQLVQELAGPRLARTYGFALSVSAAQANDLIDDPLADELDAVLCAVQAGWAYCQGDGFGVPPSADPIEGWISDPHLLEAVGE